MNVNEEEYNQENPFGLETESDFHTTRRNVTISLIEQYTPGKVAPKILDVGCGKGNITKIIKHKFPEAIIDGIDISGKAIEMAKREDAGVNFTKADAMTFGGFGYKYDVVVLNNIYEHIENPAGMLINLKSVLAADGVFIISTPNRYHIKNMLRKLFGLNIVIPDYHITEYSIGQLFDHHKYAGLDVKAVILPVFRKERNRMLDILVLNIMQPLLDAVLKLIKSKTRLGSLLFIVSRK